MCFQFVSVCPGTWTLTNYAFRNVFVFVTFCDIGLCLDFYECMSLECLLTHWIIDHYLTVSLEHEFSLETESSSFSEQITFILYQR
jgi:hypothetical protein